MSDERDDRPDDRAAILARRQQFIALALTGLASTACTDGKTRDTGNDAEQGQQDPEPPPQPCLSEVIPPQPCLEVAPPRPCLDVAPPDDPTQGAPQDPPEDPPPQVCLKVAAPEDEPEDPRPHACLKIARPPDESPKPCLRKVAPDPDE